MHPGFFDLQHYSFDALDALLASRSGPAPQSLVPFIYRGLSLQLPAPAFSLFGKFGKTFVADATGHRGWNVRMHQNGVDDTWRPVLFKAKPVTYGHYRLRPGDTSDPFPNALVIDYAPGGNRRLDPLQRVVDYVVAVGGDDLLLGRMYLRLANRLVPTRSYFALQRYLPVDADVSPPCG